MSLTDVVPSSVALRPSAQRAFAISAILAWLGVAVSITLNVFGVYASEPPTPTSYGWNPAGAAGALSRLFDSLSYFTIWSNTVVAVTLTLLARRPSRGGRLFGVLRLDSLIMISITGIVYWLLLAPSAKVQGFEWVSNSLLHYITPVLTIIVWAVWGPRGLFRWSTIPAALVIPIAWIFFVLIRGAIINAYPYGFLDVAKYGLTSVLTTVVIILVFGILLAVLYVGIDKAVTRRALRRAASH